MTAAIQPKPKLATNPYVGIVGVFLGATLATMNARLISVGLPDLRGALGLGFDQASWLPTALNMATMFSGLLCGFLERLVWATANLDTSLDRVRAEQRSSSLRARIWLDCGADGGRWVELGNLLLPDHDLCTQRASQETHHFRRRGLCGRHCFHGERRPGSRKLVHPTSIVALDLLEFRGSGAFHGSLRLLRNSERAFTRAASQLARVYLLKRGIEPDLRRARPR